MFKTIISNSLILFFLFHSTFSFASNLQALDFKKNFSTLKQVTLFYKKLARVDGRKKNKSNKKFISPYTKCANKKFKDGIFPKETLAQCHSQLSLKEQSHLNHCIYNGLKKHKDYKRSIKFKENPMYLMILSLAINHYCTKNYYTFFYDQFVKDSKKYFDTFLFLPTEI